MRVKFGDKGLLAGVRSPQHKPLPVRGNADSSDTPSASGHDLLLSNCFPRAFVHANGPHILIVALTR
jgi:hypothetical protein